jgi:hypothetical protein
MEPKDDTPATTENPPNPKKAVSFRAFHTTDDDEKDSTNPRNNGAAAPLPPSRATMLIPPSPRPGLTRSQNYRHLDLCTGQNTRRQQTIQTVDPRHREARSRWKKVASRLSLLKNNNQAFTTTTATKMQQIPDDHQSDQQADEEVSTPTVQQYRIRSRVVYNDDSDEPSILLGGGKKKRPRRCLGIFTSAWWKSSALEGRHEMGASGITDLLMWSYKAYFFQVIIAIFLISMALTVFFAAMIYINVYFEPGCVNVGGEEFQIYNKRSFMDAYQLSWTTMVTVSEEENQMKYNHFVNNPLNRLSTTFYTWFVNRRDMVRSIPKLRRLKNDGKSFVDVVIEILHSILSVDRTCSVPF